MSTILDNKETKDIVETLKNLGLNPKESAIYLALISLGEVGASPIVSETGLHRQFVYDNLASLEEKGLIGHSIVRGRKKFYNHGLSKLSAMFEHKKRLADDVIKQIEKKLLPVDMQQFEIYRGVDTFVTNELEMIKSVSPGSKVYIFGGTGDGYHKTMGRFLNEYEYIRVKKNIEVMYLGSAEQKKYLETNKDERRLFNYRLLPSGFSGELNISVYEDRVSLIMFSNPIASFTVISPKIAKSYIDFFMGLWNISK